MFSEINQMLRASVPILLWLLRWIAVPATAFARTVYDGDWSVLILTRGGACEPAVRYGVQIADGMVINGGGMATVQGRVTRSGTVSVMRAVRQPVGQRLRPPRQESRRRRLVGPRHERRLPRHLGGGTARVRPGSCHLRHSDIEEDWMPDDATIVALRGDHLPILKTR